MRLRNRHMNCVNTITLFFVFPSLKKSQSYIKIISLKKSHHNKIYIILLLNISLSKIYKL